MVLASASALLIVLPIVYSVCMCVCESLLLKLHNLRETNSHTVQGTFYFFWLFQVAHMENTFRSATDA